MSPHPVKDIDLDRKEELIMAKQLRAARVTILPRRVDSSYVAKKEPKPAPPPTPKAQPRSVAKAQNPIALRYWSQCMALASTTEINVPIVQEDNLLKQNFNSSMPPWADSDTHLSPNLPNPSVNGGVHGKQADKFGIKVPNINKQIRQDSNTIKKTDWAKILAEEDEHLEKHRKFKLNQNQRLNIETPKFLRKQRPIIMKTQSKVNFETNQKECRDSHISKQQETISKTTNAESKIEYARNTIGTINDSQQNKTSLKNGTNHEEQRDSQISKQKETKVIQISKTTNIEIERGNAGSTKESMHDVLEKHKTLLKNGGDKNCDLSNDEGIALTANKRNDLKMQTWNWKSKPSGTILNNECSCQKSSKNSQNVDEQTDMRQFVNSITPRLNETQIKQLGMLCFDKLSPDVKDDLVGRHLSTIHISELSKLLFLIKGEVLDESLANIFPKLSSSSQLSVSKSILSIKDVLLVSESEDKSKFKILNGEHLPCKENMYENDTDNQNETKDNEIPSSGNINKTIDLEQCIEDQSEIISVEEQIKENKLVETKDAQCQKEITQINGLTQDSNEVENNNDNQIENKEDSALQIEANQTNECMQVIDNEIFSEENSSVILRCSSSENNTNLSADNIEEGKSLDVDDQQNSKQIEENLECVKDETHPLDAENQLDIEEETSNDVSYIDMEDEKDYDLYKTDDKSNIQNGSTEKLDETQTPELQDSDPNVAESGDESWEWEEEDENEYEYYEQDDDEYKVQTFDGSFSVSLNN